MKSKFTYVLLLSALLGVTGCTSIISATTDEPIDLDPDRRTFGTSIDDSQIETIAAVNLNNVHPLLEDSPISVHSYNRVVLLTGQVKNTEMRELAGKTVAKMTTVRQVHNELEIAAPVGFFSTVNDAWITSKVKTKLAASDDVRSNRVEVITENSKVYFMGMLPRAEAEHAARIASETGGVQKVVLAIEYTD
ncbi:BON domain-containing protein [Aurantivibrio plasticivorans]